MDCVLHSINIVNQFPKGCPFLARSPMSAIGSMRNRAWKMLVSDDPVTKEEGGALLGQKNTCVECVSENSKDAIVRRIRAKASRPP